MGPIGPVKLFIYRDHNFVQSFALMIKLVSV